MDFFEQGQAYVAFSRVRLLDDLFLRDLNMQRIIVSPEVIKFYRENNLL
jgi:hypothetical protein